MYGRISAAPSAQLRPTASGRTWRTEFQNASGVWPDSVRPDASVIVPETITGKRCAARARSTTRSRTAPPWRSACRRSSRPAAGRRRLRPAPSTASVYAATSSSKRDVARARIVDVGRDRRRAVGRAERAGDEARLCRASAPSTRRRTRARSRAAARLISRTCASHPVVGLRDRRRVERVGLDDVGAGLEVGVVDRRGRRPGCVSTSRSLSPLRSCAWSWNGAAEVGLGRAGSCWIIVPIAPSRTRMRSSQQAGELGGAVGLHGESRGRNRTRAGMRSSNIDAALAARAPR